MSTRSELRSSAIARQIAARSWMVSWGPPAFLAFVSCAVLLLAACQTAPKSQPVPPDEVPPGTLVDQMPLPEGEFSFSGGDGASLNQAVIVSAENEKIGVAALYGWISKQYPGSKAEGQS